MEVNWGRFFRYMTVVLRGVAVAVSVFFLTLYIGRALINAVTPIYRSIALIEATPTPAISSTTIGETNSKEAGDETPQIAAAPVLSDVVTDLDLEQVWSKRYLDSRMRVTHQQAIDHLAHMLKVGRKAGTDIYSISGFSSEPTEAAAIANAIANAYKMKRDMDAPSGIVTGAAVRIVTRSEVPTAPIRPNRRLDKIIVEVLAVFLSIGIASSVEVVFLLLRAAGRPES